MSTNGKRKPNSDVQAVFTTIEHSGFTKHRVRPAATEIAVNA